jgi:hypothetical protein
MEMGLANYGVLLHRPDRCYLCGRCPLPSHRSRGRRRASSSIPGRTPGLSCGLPRVNPGRARRQCSRLRCLDGKLPGPRSGPPASRVVGVERRTCRAVRIYAPAAIKSDDCGPVVSTLRCHLHGGQNRDSDPQRRGLAGSLRWTDPGPSRTQVSVPISFSKIARPVQSPPRNRLPRDGDRSLGGFFDCLNAHQPSYHA